jgi:hypothetical protein
VEFIVEDGYDIKPGMQEEYQQFLLDNADRLRAAMPDGVEYIGDFVFTWGNDPEAGQWRMLTRLDSYGALDRLASAAKGDGELGKLIRESARFLDMSKDTTRWRHTLLKSVTDATVINLPTED